MLFLKALLMNSSAPELRCADYLFGQNQWSHGTFLRHCKGCLNGFNDLLLSMYRDYGNQFVSLRLVCQFVCQTSCATQRDDRAAVLQAQINVLPRNLATVDQDRHRPLVFG